MTSRVSKANSISNVSALASLFSSKVIRQLSKGEEPKLFMDLVFESRLDHHWGNAKNVGDIFDIAFSLLCKRDLRHEYIYKAALFEKIVLGKNSLRTATALSELRINDSKIDFAVLNGSAVGYEIKSERDNLSKLDKQLSDYRQFFPEVNVVVGETHLTKIEHKVHKDVGIIILNRRFQLSTVREATLNFDTLEVDGICSSLRLVEAKKIAELNGLNILDVPTTQIHDEVFSKIKTLSAIDLHNSLMTVLKETRGLMDKTKHTNALPRSLKVIVSYLNLTKSEYSTLIQRLHVPILKL